ncbi:unnamed protein product [Clavelina lepadiformis]|uniref:G-protein coupled receptors family 1 profile domain-containing protein n=1 Tax=Clavelina lepadiformis TaxID=159417 RepID=A0ABP0FZY3_CLALP
MHQYVVLKQVRSKKIDFNDLWQGLDKNVQEVLLKISPNISQSDLVYVLRICNYDSLEDLLGTISSNIVIPKCQLSEFNCNCPFFNEELLECIPWRFVCDGWTDCSNGIDEFHCICPPGYFQCNDCSRGGANCLDKKSPYECINESKIDDDYDDCWNRRDETKVRFIEDKWKCDNGQYIFPSFLCDGLDSCGDGSDELNCSDIICPSWSPHRCDCNMEGNNTCKQRNPCYGDTKRCDGIAWCEDHTDEKNCSVCPSSLPTPCNCNQLDNYTCKGVGPTCFIEHVRCDGGVDCTDGSDEINCTCTENTFKCSCVGLTCNVQEGCIGMENVNDGKLDCKDASDEFYVKAYKRVQCGPCDMTIIRLDESFNCRSPWCDKTTCYEVPSLECSLETIEQCNSTDVLCASFCPDNSLDCNNILQCSDQTEILNYNFCDGSIDCMDGSDNVISGFGFKCTSKVSPVSCVIPQWNLYDNIPQCFDKSDLCFSADDSFNCFKCLDNRLIISPKQICDGVIDCYDLSDECLCETPTLTECFDMFQASDQSGQSCGLSKKNILIQDISNTLCSNASCTIKKPKVNETELIVCRTKRGTSYAKKCDGRPECIDFIDECFSCSNLPAFCNDTCRSFFPMEDRYCDGFIDEAWHHLNNSNCPLGFDERKCSKRFKCQAGRKISIDIMQKCNGIEDCNDGSDETGCDDRHYCLTTQGLISVPNNYKLDGKRDCIDGTDEFKLGVFSSSTNLIDSVGLCVWFWIVLVVILVGNTYVIIFSVKDLQSKELGDGAKCNKMLILNLSISDLLMGIYLLIVMIKAWEFSGVYAKYDVQWRVSMLCSIAGSLCLVSSQTSCFIMVILTALRMYSVFYPFKARHPSVKIWVSAAFAAWVVSLVIAVMSNTIHYFRHAVIFPNPFSTSDTVKHDDVISFACYVASITNTTMNQSSNTWKESQAILIAQFRQYPIRGEMGYYGTISVCMPRLFVTPSDGFKVFSTTVISINLLSFLFVGFGFISIYKKSSKRPTQSAKAKEEKLKMRNRVFRLIISDLLCWFPICIMAFLSLAGIELPSGIEILTAGGLLTINSALNPLLYSPHIEAFIEGIVRKVHRADKSSKKANIELRVCDIRK